MATNFEIQEEIARMRIEMDCKSEHCYGCPYLVRGVCELAESVYMAATDF